DHRIAPGSSGDIGGHAIRLHRILLRDPPRLADNACFAARRDQHIGALGGESLRHREPDPHASARDDRELPPQPQVHPASIRIWSFTSVGRPSTARSKASTDLSNGKVSEIRGFRSTRPDAIKLIARSYWCA